MSDINIADIIIGERHRKDMGDLDALAASIKEQGLLQPIGINEDKVLVFGERRLRACRDILGWTVIDAGVVNVTSMVEGEHAENEMREDFRVSEKVAIAAAVKAEIGKRQGQRTDLAAQAAKFSGRTDDEVARLVGFGSAETLKRAETVVEHGSPELIEAPRSSPC